MSLVYKGIGSRKRGGNLIPTSGDSLEKDLQIPPDG